MLYIWISPNSWTWYNSKWLKFCCFFFFTNTYSTGKIQDAGTLMCGVLPVNRYVIVCTATATDWRLLSLKHEVMRAFCFLFNSLLISLQQRNNGTDVPSTCPLPQKILYIETMYCCKNSKTACGLRDWPASHRTSQVGWQAPCSGPGLW